MFTDLGPGQTISLDPPAAGVELLFSHEYARRRNVALRRPTKHTEPEDSVGRGSIADENNLYQYVRSRPTTSTDPFGLWAYFLRQRMLYRRVRRFQDSSTTSVGRAWRH